MHLKVRGYKEESSILLDNRSHEFMTLLFKIHTNLEKVCMSFSKFSTRAFYFFLLFKAWIQHPITSPFSFAFLHFKKNYYFQMIYLNYTGNLLIITLAPREKQSYERGGFSSSKQKHSIHGALKCFLTLHANRGGILKIVYGLNDS